MHTDSLFTAEPFIIHQDYATYTNEQHAVWAELVRRVYPELEKHAAREYLEGFEIVGLQRDRLPNLDLINKRLMPRTGWNCTSVSGFLPAAAFFELLAARQFPTTTWLRSKDSLEYIPEPDIFHDVFGHVPMHAHSVFTESMERYGRLCASTQSEQIIEKLSRAFWYTVEFGLIRQAGQVKAFGSGLMSSHGECMNVMNGNCAIHEFSLDEVLATPIRPNQQHSLLFAVDSFEQIYDAMHESERRAMNGTL
ncbi:MAG: phenylalanine 4-monooxygenase [Acidobacteriota bacterium]|nr:phenylalanine 4-monooxygenase [Acidobacteriota bacterium]